MSKIFQDLNLRNNPKRNGFPLSHRVNFTAKVGEILPVDHFDVIIGDKWRIDLSNYTRTAPADTAAAVVIKEYFDVYFVPYRLTWKNSPAVHTQNTKNPVSATSPYSNLPVGSQTPQFDFYTYYPFTPRGAVETIIHRLGQKTNEFGYNRGSMSAKLMNHLGYTYFSIDNITDAVGSLNPSKTKQYWGPRYLSLYPLLAYQCIYYNMFRNSQWQDNVPYNYNVDYLSQNALVSFNLSSTSSEWQEYWDNPTLFDLQYSNYPKDLFFGFFPDAQYGDEATVDVKGSAPVVTSYNPTSNAFATGASTVNASGSSEPSTLLRASNAEGPRVNGALTAVLSSPLFPNFEASFGILELRKAQALQKYKEIRGSGNQSYGTLIQKIFGVSVPDTLDTVPLYLGGYSSEVKFSEVVNTNLVGSNDADIKGKGTGGSRNNRVIEFEPKENGCIMILYHAQPVVDYALDALHFDVVRTEADDFANPLFDQLGFQELPFYFLASSAFNNFSSGSVTTLGYTTRYFDYKCAVDRTLGDFRETSKTWLAPIDFDYLKQYTDSFGTIHLNYNFFKVNPAILDPIFSVQAAPAEVVTPGELSPGDTVDTDQLKIFANLDISVIRPLDRDGTPY